MVALAIMGIGLLLVMELFGGALRSGRLSQDYTRALIYAKGQMEEVLLNPEEGSDSGEFEDGYRWESEIKRLKTDQTWETFKIKVRVLFSGLSGEKRVELVTIKTIPSKE